MSAPHESEPTQNQELPMMQAALGLIGSKDGKGIGDVADPETVAAWVRDYLAGQDASVDPIQTAAAFPFGVRAESRYAGQSFVEAEAEIRSEWSSEKNRKPWDTVREMVWAGFDRARDKRV